MMDCDVKIKIEPPDSPRSPSPDEYQQQTDCTTQEEEEEITLPAKARFKVSVNTPNGKKRLVEVLKYWRRDVDTKLVYVHYVKCNKRLDEWININLFDMKDIIQLDAIINNDVKPLLLAIEEKKIVDEETKTAPTTSRKAQQRGGNRRSQNAVLTTLTRRQSARLANIKKEVQIIEPVSPRDENDVKLIPKQEIKTEKEERLIVKNEKRPVKSTTSGTCPRIPKEEDVSAEEVIAVKNISMIELGRYRMKPWYFSPYPQRFSKVPMVYICEFCLSYKDSFPMFQRHRMKCVFHCPPGKEIYRSPSDALSVFEVDGRIHNTYSRNLALLSKLFLDHKTVYFDVDPFLFYILTTWDTRGHHVIGYFSKEKISVLNYNVACILTLPPYQRKGYGRFLIDFSYCLSRAEKKHGSPEKPLSDLGLLSYRSYWSQELLKILIDIKDGSKPANSVSTVCINDMCNMTGITYEDVKTTLLHLNILVYSGRGYHFQMVDMKKYRDAKEKGERQLRVDPKLLHWSPKQLPKRK